MAKPTQKPAWVPDNSTNITDPGSKATYGWLSGDAAPSEAFNWFWNRVSQWIDYVDALDHFEGNHTIAVTDDATLAAAIAEVATLPKNMNNYTLTITIATGSYALASAFTFDGFYNGEIIITGTGSPVLTSSGIGGLALDVENCDKFTATGVEFNSDPAASYSNKIHSINAVSLTGCTLTNTSAAPSSSALQAKNVGSCYLSGCTFTAAAATGYTAEAVFTNINVVGTTTITNSGSVFIGSQGGRINYEAPSDIALIADIGAGKTGGEFIGKYNHITLLDYDVPLGTTTAAMNDIQPGKTLTVYSSVPGLVSTIKVVNVVGSRIYFFATSGATTPGATWVALRDASGTNLIGNLWTAYAGTGYTVIRDII